MIKLVVTDVDGTLLDQESNLPSLNKRALFACKDKGIGVVLATGKTADSIISIINLLDLKLPQITQCGGVIINKDHRIINSIKIEPRHYYKVIRTIKQRGYKPLVCLEDGKIFYEQCSHRMKNIEDVGERLIKVDSIETTYFSKNAININVPIKDTDPLDSYLRKMFSDVLQIVRSGKYFFDMMNLDTSKGEALKFVAKLLDINRDEIAVFGDSYNDLSLFDFAGIKIAVKNSYPEVLEKADIITDENYKGGLGKAIYKYILN